MFRQLPRHDVLGQLGMTLEDVASSVFLTGTTGSGKTSVMKILAYSVLNFGVGCLWACAKASEAANAAAVIGATVMRDRVLRLVPGQFTFNFPYFEVTRPGGSPASLARLFVRLNEMLNRSKQGASSEGFWTNLFFNYMLFSVTLSWLAHRSSMTVATIADVLNSCPPSLEVVRSPDFVHGKFYQLLKQAEANLTSASEKRWLEQLLAFFLDTQTTLGSRARGAAITQCQNVLSPFLLPPLYETVCAEKSTFTPDMPLDGICAILDAPILVYQEGGLLLQNLIVMMTQEAALRSTTRELYCAIVRDETQMLIADPSFDMMVQSVSRESKLCHFSATQSIPLLRSAFGGDAAAEQMVLAWLANYRTKFALANICNDTNTYYSTAFGQHKEQFISLNEHEPSGEQESLYGTVFSGNCFRFGTSEQMHHRVPPDRFLSLRRGGPQNAYLIDAFMTMGGHTFDNGLPFQLVTFSQR